MTKLGELCGQTKVLYKDKLRHASIYNMDTAGGQSGSPVYDLNNEIIGIYTTGAGSKNIGTKLNDEYYQFVSENTP